MYKYRPATGGKLKTQILASGVAVPWAVEAAQILQEEWDVAADVWSVTSWNELRRDGLETDRYNFMHPNETPAEAFVTKQLKAESGPIVAVSDFMNAVQDQIRPWVPGDFSTLGADGFGFSDTRAAARRFFGIDSHSIVVKVLQRLAASGEISQSAVTEAFVKYKLDDVTAGSTGNTGGDA
jgi:pyruvate dehydrogenase E1 component